MKAPSQAVLDIARSFTNVVYSDIEDTRLVLRALLMYLDQEAERAKPTPVVCPECTAAGAKSKIVKRHTGGATMDVYYPPKFHFDDDGREHFHDENRQTNRVGYECAAGHQISVLVSAPCWCGWEYLPPGQLKLEGAP
jgi:hypothetical protein